MSTTVPKIAYSPGEACEAIGCSRDWLYKQIRSGALRTTAIGRRRFIAVTELERFVNGEDAA